MGKESIQISDKTVNLWGQPYIIAEMACAHNGSVDEAKALIDAAVAAKADAVQLQFFIAEETVTPTHQAFDVVKSIEFSFDTWRSLVQYAKQFDIAVWACTYDVPSVELAVETGCDGIKLNSSDLSNPDVLKAVAASKIPFTLGTGASTRDEIQAGIQLLEEAGADSIVLMHGVQNFPTQNEDLHINRIDWLKEQFPKMPIGYADHTEGEDDFAEIVDLLAVSKGAAVIEKHITLDRSQKGIDYQAALEPNEFKLFVANIRRAYEALGSSKERPFSESDIKYRTFQKKSIVAAHNLEKGKILEREDVMFIRNIEPGLAPKDFHLLEGKALKQNLSTHDNIGIEHV